jgi:SRSO17 transposase
LSRELETFILTYQDVLKSKTYSYTAKAHQYVCGLFQAEKRNIEKICEKVVESEMQNLNHFISESPWEWEAVIERIGEDTSRLFADGSEKIGLLIDESGWKKAGKQSVGVGRQYLGSLGKVDNGQVAVFASLVQGEHVGIIDTRLYLPDSWTSAPKRCRKAGIPADKMAFRTKPELALELVRAARKNGIRYDWIGGDGLYGHDSKFRYALAADGERYVLDVHDDETVYLEEPCPYIPEKKPGRGRTPTRYQVAMESIKVKEIVRELDESCFKAFCFRDGSKGGKWRKVYVQEVYTWNGEEATPRKERVIVSKNLDGTEVKYSLCHEQGGNSSWCDLLYMQMQRFWVEQSVKDAKSELGMAEYQVRTWRAWHHHMTLTMLALLFMLQQKLSHQEDSPLLSCSDIRFILAHTLPQKVVSKDDVLDMIEQRHHRRQYDLDRYAES